MKLRPLTLLVVFVLVACSHQSTLVWPDYAPGNSYAQLVAESRAEYASRGYDYTRRIATHSATSDYLNYGTTKRFREIPDLIRLDEDGVPMRTYGDGNYHYNPVLVAQHALNLYGRYLAGEKTLPAFYKSIDRLLSLQDDRGAFTYGFEWRYYLLDDAYPPGWTSGMAQGQALSVLARAYHLTEDERYWEAAAKALDYLLTPVGEGGVMDTLEDLDPILRRYVVFEEYLADPASYTLNGFMFALLGLYDWATVSKSPLAGSYFRRGVATLRNLLPYYDLGGFSAYDLSHITWEREPHVGISYHMVHIYQLHALHGVTGDSRLGDFSRKWASYVE